MSPPLFAVEGTPCVVPNHFLGVDISVFAVSRRKTQRFTLLIRRRTGSALCDNLFHSVPHAHAMHQRSLQQFSRNVVSEFSLKLLKLLPQDVRFIAKCTEFNFGCRGSATDPTSRACSSPRPPTDLRGAYYSKCREEKGREENGWDSSGPPSIWVPLFFLLIYARAEQWRSGECMTTK